MPNTPCSYHDVKLLAGDVPDPVPVESVYRVIKSAGESSRRDLEIQALRRSLNAERAARYRVEHKLERLSWTVTSMSTACVILSIAGILALASAN